eukprot:gb/GEZJ01004587.1/.p1 GENE.gb/GEZJ01004587.1/~~gb/GEZJ01004587.1/.p1  ORF type:complete len:188 (-),score=14.60 gb/GEZJ01004587.1/:737-1300(-)
MPGRNLYIVPTSSSFVLEDGSSPLHLGLDIKRYANTIHLSSPSHIELRRPGDTKPRRFLTYLSQDKNDARLRLEIAPLAHSTAKSLLATFHGKADLLIAKKGHGLTHAHADAEHRGHGEAAHELVVVEQHRPQGLPGLRDHVLAQVQEQVHEDHEGHLLERQDLDRHLEVAFKNKNRILSATRDIKL